MTRAKRKYIFIYAALIFFAAVFLVPIGVMISTSMKSPPELVNVLALPKGFYRENHRAAFEIIGRGMLNSLLITLPAVFISSFVGRWVPIPFLSFALKGTNLSTCFCSRVCSSPSRSF